MITPTDGFSGIASHPWWIEKRRQDNLATRGPTNVVTPQTGATKLCIRALDDSVVVGGLGGLPIEDNSVNQHAMAVNPSNAAPVLSAISAITYPVVGKGSYDAQVTFTVDVVAASYLYGIQIYDIPAGSATDPRLFAANGPPIHFSQSTAGTYTAIFRACPGGASRDLYVGYRDTSGHITFCAKIGTTNPNPVGTNAFGTVSGLTPVEASVTTAIVNPVNATGNGATYGVSATIHLTSPWTSGNNDLAELETVYADHSLGLGSTNEGWTVAGQPTGINATGNYNVFWNGIGCGPSFDLGIRGVGHDGKRSNVLILSDIGQVTQVMDLGEVTRPVNTGANGISLNGAITYAPKSPTTYDAIIPFTTFSGGPTWNGATAILWSYRQVAGTGGGTGPYIDLIRTNIVGGNGTNVSGSVTIPHLTIDPANTWGLYAQYVNPAGGVGAQSLVATTGVRTAINTSAMGIPSGFAMPNPSQTISTISPPIGFNVQGSSSYGTLINFTTSASITPPGGTANGTAPWAVALQPIRAILGSGQWEIAGLPTSTNTSGSYSLFWNIPRANRYDYGYLVIDGLGNPSPVALGNGTYGTYVYQTPVGAPRHMLGGGNETWPAGTTFTNSTNTGIPSGSVTGYGTTVGSVGPTATVALNIGINLPGGSASLGSYLSAVGLLVQTALATDTNGGTNTSYGLWQEANYYSGPALPSSMSCQLVAGQAQNIGIVFFDTNNNPTQVYPLLTLSAQQISGNALGSIGSELLDNPSFENTLPTLGTNGNPGPVGWYVQANTGQFDFFTAASSPHSGVQCAYLRLKQNISLPTGVSYIAAFGPSFKVPASGYVTPSAWMAASASGPSLPAGISLTLDVTFRWYSDLAATTAVGSDTTLGTVTGYSAWTQAAPGPVPAPAGAVTALLFMRLTITNSSGSSFATGSSNLYCDARFDDFSAVPAIVGSQSAPGQVGRGHFKPPVGVAPIYPITDAVVDNYGQILHPIHSPAVVGSLDSTAGIDGSFIKSGILTGRHFFGASSSDAGAVMDSNGRHLLSRHEANVQALQSGFVLGLSDKNLVRNPGFETPARPGVAADICGAYWQANTSSSIHTMAVSANQPRNGTKSALIGVIPLSTIAASTTYQASIIQTSLAVRAGDTLYASAFYKAFQNTTIAGVSVTMFILIGVSYSDGTSDTVYTPTSPTFGGASTQLTAQITANPAKVPTQAFVALYSQVVNSNAFAVNPGNASLCDIYFDDVRVGQMLDYDSLRLTRSTPYNSLPSILPITTDFQFNYVFTSGTTTMKWYICGAGGSGSSVNFFPPDGSPAFIAPSVYTAGSQGVYDSGGTGLTIYALIFWSKTLGTWSYTFQTGAFSAATVRSAYQDGYVALFATYSNNAALQGVTGTTGGGTGKSGGGRINF